MAMFKHVAGVGNVEMKPDEEAAWIAESEANDPANRPPFQDITPDGNGEALDGRQRETAKEEAAALWKAGKQEAAFNKLLELI